MTYNFRKLIFSTHVLFLLMSNTIYAAPIDDARLAANNILKSVHDMKYQDLWDNMTSDFYKKAITEQSFINNITLARNPMGKVQSSQGISEAHATYDPDSGYKGDIFVFDYNTKYDSGDYAERIVVINENNSGYKMSGLYGVKKN